MKYLNKIESPSLGVYYTNLLGRAISTYNNKETSFLLEGEQLLVYNSLSEITLEKAQASCVVVVLVSGGAMPYRIGSHVSRQQLVGSLYSITIYENECYQKDNIT